MQNPTRILLVGGGSGGHIIPNLAVSSELKAQNPSVQLLYIGSRNPPDRTLVEKAGIPFRSIFTGKLRRYFSMRNFIDPFQVVIGIFQSIYFVARFWPDVVFTKGGFVSFPVTLAAFVLRRPVVLHESDAVMGLTNRITAKIATKVCVGFPNYLHLSDRFVLTGNPVRSSILHGSKDRGYQLTGFSVDRPVLLAWGGSQGAQEINDLIESRFSLLEPHFQIVHITGEGKATSIHHPRYKSFDYLGEELRDIYAITDFIVGRAGANSLYELALLQKPNLLLPLQNSAHNHQARNAEYFEKAGASIVVPAIDDFVPLLLSLLNDVDRQEKMRHALASLSRPHAAKEIAELILHL